MNVVKFHSALFKLMYTRLPKEFIVSFRRCNTCSLSFHGRLFPIHVGVKQLIADLSGGAHISRSLTYLTKEEAYLTKLRESHKRGTIVLCLHQGHPSLGMTFITSVRKSASQLIRKRQLNSSAVNLLKRRGYPLVDPIFRG